MFDTDRMVKESGGIFMQPILNLVTFGFLADVMFGFFNYIFYMYLYIFLYV